MRAPKAKGKATAQAATAEPAAPSDADIPKGKDLKSNLAAHVEYMKRELIKIRGATANPNMLDNVIVDVYGETQQLKEVAQVALKNPLLLVVSPFDSAMVDAVADAIRDADMGLNPSLDGNSVRVPVPKTSKETREANVKLIGKVAEQAKTRIRRSRQDAIEKSKKGGEGISEDDIKRDTKLIEEQVAAVTAEVAKLAEKKKLEVEAT
jgi:ribosome recycling factor